MNIQHILVTTDLSPESLRPAPEVAALARLLGARVTLLYVVQDLAATPHGAPFAPALEGVDLAPRLEEARRELEAQREVFGPGVAASLEVVPGTDVAQAVAEYARRNAVDLVALSTHGRTGFRHLALGSVAEALLRRSAVPVLVFPRARE